MQIHRDQIWGKLPDAEQAAAEETKKFDPKAFALELRDDIQQNRIKLPTLPALSLEALVVVNDAGSSMADVARMISKDTSMAARLVRYANSPLYRGISNVASVKAAITRIGMDAVKHAILSLAMRDVFTTGIIAIQARMEALWKHSVIVATKSALLAEQFTHLNRDEAMLAGLIHDVGAIPILIKAKDHQFLLDDEKKLDKLVDALHMSVGKFMLTFWNFDPSMIDVAANHDRLDRKPPGEKVDYVDIVQVANILSYEHCQDHRLGNIDTEKIPAFQRVGPDLIEQFKQRSAGEFEANISEALH
ncbi:MAG: HDOD domain-containing protein [Gammaproteobacteria bacterium]|nr:HDOD domain-containing protein [Gammaproteobacteria bacterium]MCB1878549.1 HDOD domain-containing protein [Gammaproteobacteria bacterium]